MKIRTHAAALLVALSTLTLTSNAVQAQDIEAGKIKAAVCAGCHGANGKAIQEDYPNLAGQSTSYLLKQLQDFKSGTRQNAIMAPMAGPLTDEDMANIAAYYASLPAIQGIAKTENLEAGQAIYRGGITSASIPACTACHGPNGQGNPAAGWPALAGQNASYTYTALQQFRAGTRSNDLNAMMRNVAHRMTNEEIAAVANYIQGLK